MKLIGAGFGRTGTASLKEALETLGYAPCYHMWELFEHPHHSSTWLSAAAGEPMDWDTIFEEFQATVDWPGAAFWEQLVERYPDAPVLLSVRDPDAWYDSVAQTIYPASAAAAGSTFSSGDDPTAAVINTIIWQGTFDGRFLDREHAISVFEQHNERVRRCIPPERLLVYNVKEGWEPLCAFLGVPVPADTPFPHRNTKEEWNREPEPESTS
jgi:hypothetical protein